MPYESHVTTSPVFDKPAYITYPFADLNDTSSKIVHQPLLQIADKYAPPAINGVFSAGLANISGTPVTIGSAYCIGDTEPQPVDSGLVSFTRRWANIPAENTEYIGSMSFAFPQVASVSGAFKTITSVTGISGTTATYNVTAHGYANGTSISLSIVMTGGGIYIYSGVVSAAATNSFTSTYLLGTRTFASGSVRSGVAGSAARNRSVHAYVVSEFCIPGVTSGIATIDDFKPYPLFQAIDNVGAAVQYIDTTTTPNNTNYGAMVASGQSLIAESIVTRFMAGIFVRKTTYVKAV